MSAPEFPAYDPDATCPKCGHDEVGTRYHARTCDSWSPASCKWNDYSGHSCCAAEHLDRTCGRCHYGWPEAVARD